MAADPVSPERHMAGRRVVAMRLHAGCGHMQNMATRALRSVTEHPRLARRLPATTAVNVG